MLKLLSDISHTFTLFFSTDIFNLNLSVGKQVKYPFLNISKWVLFSLSLISHTHISKQISKITPITLHFLTTWMFNVSSVFQLYTSNYENKYNPGDSTATPSGLIPLWSCVLSYFKQSIDLLISFGSVSEGRGHYCH